jgi:hypothetical protein
MKRLVALSLVLLTLSGCASFRHAVEAMPQRIDDAFSDPVRRTHIVTQAGRIASSAGIGITCVSLLAPTVVGMLVCPIVAIIADFLSYEFVLEPLSKELVKEGKPSLIGPYWETGPRTDEGEVFVAP